MSAPSSSTRSFHLIEAVVIVLMERRFLAVDDGLTNSRPGGCGDAVPGANFQRSRGGSTLRLRNSLIGEGRHA